MTFSLSTASCPALDFSFAALAARLGFDGIELPAFSDPSRASSTNALLTSPAKIRSALAAAGLGVSSLDIGTDALELPDRITLAGELNCPHVRFAWPELTSGKEAIAARAVDWIRACADLAADSGVTLLIENDAQLGGAVRLWHLLDRIDHPALACGWNSTAGASAGESSSVAVPLLNTRIQSAAFGVDECLTRADGVRNTLNRLHGIGFDGEVMVRPGTKSSVADMEQSLTEALAVVRMAGAKAATT
jgi:hypothetical protein